MRELVDYELLFGKRALEWAESALNEGRLSVKVLGDAVEAEVRGEHGTYSVYLGDSGAMCTCPAGTAGRPCKHAALVLLYLRRLCEACEEAAFGRWGP